MLAACGSSENDAFAPAKSGEAISTKDKIVAMSGANIGTPMAERIAVLGLLSYSL
jgi:Na+/phosphate symporter